MALSRVELRNLAGRLLSDARLDRSSTSDEGHPANRVSHCTARVVSFSPPAAYPNSSALCIWIGTDGPLAYFATPPNPDKTASATTKYLYNP
ncbi:hypothetical protein RRF57_011025 [Xylaria bambusicola]|uniref:Uncharacterized protein n=1 Tax=Xylaria bambusicola TaxID=326684 RepID=A0AAN7UXH5_9PEZI